MKKVTRPSPKKGGRVLIGSPDDWLRAEEEITRQKARTIAA